VWIYTSTPHTSAYCATYAHRHIYAFLTFFSRKSVNEEIRLHCCPFPLNCSNSLHVCCVWHKIWKVRSLGGVGVLTTAVEVPVAFINKIVAHPVCTAYVKVARYRNTKCLHSVIESVWMCNHISSHSHSDMMPSYAIEVQTNTNQRHFFHKNNIQRYTAQWGKITSLNPRWKLPLMKEVRGILDPHIWLLKCRCFRRSVFKTL